MNYLFDKIIIWIAIIAFAITPAVYSLNIRVLWAVILDLEANSIAATASAVIAGLIFITTLWQIRQNDKRNRLLVKPILTTISNTIEENDDDDMLRLTLDVENSGTGSAIIKNFILEVNGKEITRNNIDKNQEFIERTSTGLYFENVGFMYPRSAIKAGGSQNLWTFEYKDGASVGFVSGLNIRIEYQSVYEDEIFTCNTNRFAK